MEQEPVMTQLSKQWKQLSTEQQDAYQKQAEQSNGKSLPRNKAIKKLLQASEENVSTFTTIIVYDYCVFNFFSV